MKTTNRTCQKLSPPEGEPPIDSLMEVEIVADFKPQKGDVFTSRKSPKMAWVDPLVVPSHPATAQELNLGIRCRFNRDVWFFSNRTELLWEQNDTSKQYLAG